MVAIIKVIRYLTFVFSFLLLLWGRPKTEHKVYFKNTVRELNVYKIYGAEDGNTALILGGIQGDEPGGFRSAELYSDLKLEKGNLIVIPRMNFPSIIEDKRSINYDMNRRFDSSRESKSEEAYEDKIVEIVVDLMQESDLLLNLHDGWGFYSEKRIGPGRNPQRFGQAIIADTDIYKHKDDTIYLKKMAEKVIQKANSRINNPKHHLAFMNTRTFKEDSKFSSEMKKSATFYALKKCGIPAFGIEASKNIPDLEKKIKYHNYAINGFMELMDIKPEFPSIDMSPPDIKYLHISVNNNRPVCVETRDTLYIEQGDSIKITDIITNNKKGLSVNIHNVGAQQNLGKTYVINTNTKITLKRDSQVLSKVALKLKDAGKPQYQFVIKNDNHEKVYQENNPIYLNPDSKVKIIDVYSQYTHGEELKVNIKGFVPPIQQNTGEDRNYWVHKTDLWRKYSVNGEGKKYPIVVKKGGQIVAQTYLIFSKKQ